MNRTEKQQLIDELAEAFQQNSGVLLMDFTGLNVADATDLRRKVREGGSHYRVVKNTLAIRAAADTPVTELKENFEGPTAVAYTNTDPVALAKVLAEFVRTHPEVKFKGGVLDQHVLTAEQAESLATMPSRDELLSKLLFLLNAPLTRFASALQSPLRDLLSVLKQLAEK